LDLIFYFGFLKTNRPIGLRLLLVRGLGGHRAPDRYSIEHGVGMLVAGLVQPAGSPS
jgi:hypothetical protein